MPTGPGTADVLDVDVRPTGDGFTDLDRLARAGLLAGAHKIVSSPSSGTHYYYRPSGHRSSSLKGRFLDFKAAGGYVLLPPSVINGRPYVIVEEDQGAAGVIDWDTCSRLLDPPRPRRRHAALHASQGDIGALVTWCANLPEGNRNQGLFWACCVALDNGHDDLEPLIDAVVLIGLTEREARRTARSARDRIHGRRGAA